MIKERPLSDIEKNASSPKKVLFVCTGNTCRSPMAAALFNRMMELEERSPRAVSAGLAADGSPITPEAVKALNALHVPDTAENHYTAHISHTVTAEDMKADIILAVSPSHAMELFLRFPESAGKIGCLPIDIPDPIGGDEKVYRETAETILMALTARFGGGL